MARKLIFHLEDNPEWVEHVADMLNGIGEVLSVATYLEAGELFSTIKQEGRWFDLAIVDITLSIRDYYNRQQNVYLDGAEHKRGGLEFIQSLVESGVMGSQQIVILSGHPEVGAEWNAQYPAMRLAGIFDKADISASKQEEERFKQLVQQQLVGY